MIDFSSHPPLIAKNDLPEEYREVDDVVFNGATAAIRDYCGWHIAPSKSDVVTLDHLGRRVLQVPSLYVTAVTSVVDADNRPISDYEWSQNGSLRRVPGWPKGYRSVTVLFTHGLAATPPSIVAVLVDMIADRLDAADTESKVTSAELDGAKLGFGGTDLDSRGARRNTGAAYGHALDRYRL
ncbi:head-to-tail adaptor [Gordonia phage Madeline]|uniref:Head-to-tail adaptor n=1 Tax=Gordonia phage Madeline TaxID=2591189 RepID=A0A514A307_9CAUD|nr:head-to-tail adaptor [Gordonia phage Madeline]QDH47612.1 head-to-tail adaptor [Gordonia phage Madeline]